MDPLARRAEKEKTGEKILQEKRQNQMLYPKESSPHKKPSGKPDGWGSDPSQRRNVIARSDGVITQKKPRPIAAFASKPDDVPQTMSRPNLKRPPLRLDRCNGESRSVLLSPSSPHGMTSRLLPSEVSQQHGATNSLRKQGCGALYKLGEKRIQVPLQHPSAQGIDRRQNHQKPNSCSSVFSSRTDGSLQSAGQRQTSTPSRTSVSGSPSSPRVSSYGERASRSPAERRHSQGSEQHSDASRVITPPSCRIRHKSESSHFLSREKNKESRKPLKADKDKDIMMWLLHASPPPADHDASPPGKPKRKGSGHSGSVDQSKGSFIEVQNKAGWAKRIYSDGSYGVIPGTEDSNRHPSGPPDGPSHKRSGSVNKDGPVKRKLKVHSKKSGAASNSQSFSAIINLAEQNLNRTNTSSSTQGELGTGSKRDDHGGGRVRKNSHESTGDTEHIHAESLGHHIRRDTTDIDEGEVERLFKASLAKSPKQVECPRRITPDKNRLSKQNSVESTKTLDSLPYSAHSSQEDISVKKVAKFFNASLSSPAKASEVARTSPPKDTKSSPKDSKEVARYTCQMSEGESSSKQSDHRITLTLRKVDLQPSTSAGARQQHSHKKSVKRLVHEARSSPISIPVKKLNITTESVFLTKEMLQRLDRPVAREHSLKRRLWFSSKKHRKGLKKRYLQRDFTPASDTDLPSRSLLDRGASLSAMGRGCCAMSDSAAVSDSSQSSGVANLFQELSSDPSKVSEEAQWSPHAPLHVHRGQSAAEVNSTPRQEASKAQGQKNPSKFQIRLSKLKHKFGEKLKAAVQADATDRGSGPSGSESDSGQLGTGYRFGDCDVIPLEAVNQGVLFEETVMTEEVERDTPVEPIRESVPHEPNDVVNRMDSSIYEQAVENLEEGSESSQCVKTNGSCSDREGETNITAKDKAQPDKGEVVKSPPTDLSLSVVCSPTTEEYMSAVEFSDPGTPLLDERTDIDEGFSQGKIILLGKREESAMDRRQGSTSGNDSPERDVDQFADLEMPVLEKEDSISTNEAGSRSKSKSVSDDEDVDDDDDNDSLPDIAMIGGDNSVKDNGSDSSALDETMEVDLNSSMDETEDSQPHATPTTIMKEVTDLGKRPVPGTPSKPYSHQFNDSMSPGKMSQELLEEPLPETTTKKGNKGIKFTLDKMINMRKDSDSMVEIYNPLRQDVSNGGFRRQLDQPPADVGAGSGDDDTPSQEGAVCSVNILRKFEVEQKIPEMHPGDAVFDRTKLRQVFSYEDHMASLTGCGFKPERPTALESLMLKATPEELVFMVRTFSVEMAYHSTPCPPAFMLWMFRLMSVHTDCQVVKKVFDTMWSLLNKWPIHHPDVQPWVPSVSDLAQVLINYGASFGDLLPADVVQPGFQESDILRLQNGHMPNLEVAVKKEEQKEEEEEDSLPQLTDGEKARYYGHNLIKVVQIFTQSLITMKIAQNVQKLPSGFPYSEEEVSCLAVMVCKASLEQYFTTKAVASDFILCLAALFDSVPENQWHRQAEELCCVLPQTTPHHHNLVSLVQLMPVHTQRGRYMSRQLAYACLRKLSPDGMKELRDFYPEPQVEHLLGVLPSCKPRQQDQSRNENEALTTTTTMTKKKAPTNFYRLHSLVRLLDVAVGNETLGVAEKRALQTLILQLRELAAAIRDRARCPAPSQVKDLAVRTAVRMTFMDQAIVTNEVNLFNRMLPQSGIQELVKEHITESQEDAVSISSGDDGEEDDEEENDEE